MVACWQHRCRSMSLHMDMLAGGIADDKVFDEKIDSLSMKLSAILAINRPRNIQGSSAMRRKDSSRYQLVRRKVTISELKRYPQVPGF
jgi:cell division protein FtsI (penicillin-binding protein 3)